MPRTRPPYPEEFRRKMVELVRSGRSPYELAREFEPTAVAISYWVKQAETIKKKGGGREGKQPKKAWTQAKGTR